MIEEGDIADYELFDGFSFSGQLYSPRYTILAVLRAALNFPPSGEHGSRAVVIGGVLLGLLAAVSAVTMLLIETQFLSGDTPSFDAGNEAPGVRIYLVLGVAAACYSVVFLLLRGYDVAVLRAILDGRDSTAPAFRPGVVSDGVKAVGILLCYFVPSVVLGAVGLFLRRPTDLAVLSWIPNAVGAVVFLFGLFALVVAAYLVPAATALFATRRSIWGAFDHSAIRNCVVTEDYAVGWMLAVVVRIFLLPITIALQSVLIGFFLRFYLRVSVQHLYGLSVSNALEISAPER